MKKQGIVIKYDGYTGNIKDVNGIDYLFLKKDVMDNVKTNDEVIFNSEKVCTTYEDRNVARFVKKLKRNC